MEGNELSRALERLECSVESKCSSTVFWSSISVGVLVCLTLFSFLFTRQNGIAEAVAGIRTTLQQTKETSLAHGVLLEKISDDQTELKISIKVMAANVDNIAANNRDNGNISSDITARIAREQIAWANERNKKK